MRNIPVITKNLLIINLLVFFAQIVCEMRGVKLEDWFGLHFALAEHFYVWQFVTYMFLHGNLTHIFFNMFALWMFGRVIEATWGPKRYIIFFLVCGIGAGLVQELAQFASYMYHGYSTFDGVRFPDGSQLAMNMFLDSWNTIGASGAVYGILLAFGMLYPDERMFIFPLPFPIKARYFVIGYAVLELLQGFGGSTDGVAHFAHLGGMLFGWLLILYWQGRLHIPSYKNPFKGASWRRVVNEHPIDGFDTPEESWNARRQEREVEVDRILDKVRKHGYGALTEREKRILFNAGK